jgi:bifunctional DNA-binding transcriptional regulator/antitoxin component of YhaV-PrlF toxin-antitoxin module
MAEVKKDRPRGARRRGWTRISTKHQVTLPVDAMREAGLRPGDELRVEPDGTGRLVLVRERDVVAEFVGDMGDVYTPGLLEKLRDEWR